MIILSCIYFEFTQRFSYKVRASAFHGSKTLIFRAYTLIKLPLTKILAVIQTNLRFCHNITCLLNRDSPKSIRVSERRLLHCRQIFSLSQPYLLNPQLSYVFYLKIIGPALKDINKQHNILFHMFNTPTPTPTPFNYKIFCLTNENKN